jgi:hypothetical protein
LLMSLERRLPYNRFPSIHCLVPEFTMRGQAEQHARADLYCACSSPAYSITQQFVT